jgi:hypothetical protein
MRALRLSLRPSPRAQCAFRLHASCIQAAWVAFLQFFVNMDDSCFHLIERNSHGAVEREAVAISLSSASEASVTSTQSTNQVNIWQDPFVFSPWLGDRCMCRIPAKYGWQRGKQLCDTTCFLLTDDDIEGAER